MRETNPSEELAKHGANEIERFHLVQQFQKLYLMESLILAQNERWRRG